MYFHPQFSPLTSHFFLLQLSLLSSSTITSFFFNYHFFLLQLSLLSSSTITSFFFNYHFFLLQLSLLSSSTITSFFFNYHFFLLQLSLSPSLLASHFFLLPSTNLSLCFPQVLDPQTHALFSLIFSLNLHFCHVESFHRTSICWSKCLLQPSSRSTNAQGSPIPSKDFRSDLPLPLHKSTHHVPTSTLPNPYANTCGQIFALATEPELSLLAVCKAFKPNSQL